MDEGNYGAWMVETIFAEAVGNVILQNETKGAATPENQNKENQ